MKNIERFLNDQGQIIIWPKKHADKQLVLKYLAAKFVIHQVYTEAEVNAILKQWHTFED